MNKIFEHLKIIFSKINYILIFLLITILIGGVFFYFTDYELIKGNLGATHLYIEIILSVLVTTLFALFACVQIYKINYFNSFSKKESTSSAIGTFFGVIVGGCPACSITLASYLGLASVFAALPFFGLELKVLGVILLMYANYSILQTLNECSLRKVK